jgi:hypothetical protein
MGSNKILKGEIKGWWNLGEPAIIGAQEYLNLLARIL